SMNFRKLFGLLIVVLVLIVFYVLTAIDMREKAYVPETPSEGSSTRNVTLSFNDIIAPSAQLEKITIGYDFDTAGSPLYVDGEIYFTNNNFDPADRSATIKMDKEGNYTALRQDNGVTTTLQHSGKGTLYCCEMLGHRVIEMGLDGSVIRVVAGEYNGKRIDGPNDIYVDRKGGIYFTDSQFIGGQEKMQETPAVYYVKPDGSLIRVIDDVEFPNGVWLSPDEKTLYLCNTRGNYLRAYDVNPDGTVSNGRDFTELKLNPEIIGEDSVESGADGMVVDSAGNIFVATTKGHGIQVFDKTGKHLGNILCEAVTNNVYFGGEDLKTLYVSAKDGIYSIPVKIPGVKMPQR
ncbi:SMP-30/gluconolactonase/LRE family protein, partial [Candidatus Latescibacterota bacterium]